MSGYGLNSFSDKVHSSVPPLSEVFHVHDQSKGGATAGSYGGKKNTKSTSGSTAGSARNTANKTYRPPQARNPATNKTAASGSASGSAATAPPGSAAASAGGTTAGSMNVSSGQTAGYHKGSQSSEMHKSYAHSTWHPDWLNDAEDNFKMVKFRFRRFGKNSAPYEVVQAYAMRQNPVHTVDTTVRYHIGTSDDADVKSNNKAQVNVGRDKHFPSVLESGYVRDIDDLNFTNPLYDDMINKYKDLVGYDEIKEGSIAIYSAGLVVPQEIAVQEASLTDGQKDDIVGVNIKGVSELFHVKKCYDAANLNDDSYNVIVTQNAPVTKTVYQYHPMDHIAHYETMYGPVGKANFDKCFKSRVSGGQIPLEVTSPVFLFMLCNIGSCFENYVEAKGGLSNLSEWEQHIDKNLSIFFKRNKPLIFDSVGCDFNDNKLSDLIEQIFDQRESSKEKSYPPWTFQLERSDITFYIPSLFKDVIEKLYFGTERRDTFKRDDFNIVATHMPSSEEETSRFGSPKVNMMLEVSAFTPICFSYIRTYTE